ncbi:hypothetical protein BGX29_007188 [Mortierella sp. GBA35]|nr:hypothetical protein BGX29_007188 [Mortierella sp. GBA35]
MVHPPRTADEPHFKYGVVVDEHHHNRHHNAKRADDNETKHVVEEEDVDDGDEGDDDDDDDKDEKKEESFNILPVLKRFRRALQAGEGYEDIEYEGEFEDKTEADYVSPDPELEY